MAEDMKDVKSMMKLLVETQLDIQRSIRQEVGAMIRSSTGEIYQDAKQKEVEAGFEPAPT